MPLMKQILLGTLGIVGTWMISVASVNADPTPRPTTPPKRAVPGANQKHPQVVKPHQPAVVSLTIEGAPHLFRETKQNIVFQPDVNVRRSKYNEYIFARNVFEEKVGKPGFFEKKRVQCRVMRQKQTSRVEPVGTIVTISLYCDITDVKALPAQEPDPRFVQRMGGRADVRLQPKAPIHRQIVARADTTQPKPVALTLPHEQTKLMRLRQQAKGQRIVVVLSHPGKLRKDGVYWRYDVVSRFVKRASYGTLFLTDRDVLRFVPQKKTWKNLRVWVDIYEYKHRTLRPSNPYVSAPLGGFQFHDFYGRIVSAKPNLKIKPKPKP